MNERIHELADQAGIYKLRMSDELVLAETEYQVMEKFAELIIKECFGWINDNVGLIDEDAKADLLKHFGVKK
jgi:hypothetical protein